MTRAKLTPRICEFQDITDIEEEDSTMEFIL